MTAAVPARSKSRGGVDIEAVEAGTGGGSARDVLKAELVERVFQFAAGP